MQRAGFVVAMLCGALASPAAPLAAQHDHREHVSPYAGQEASEVPSLTDQELDDLRSGAGMGLARPAELNGYPGPKHVLELADELALSSDQLARIGDIRAAMETAAIEVGAEVIEAERSLNMRFRHRHIDEASLEEAVARIAELSGRLRVVHLRAHLETTAALTPAQIAEYDRLRGYAPAPDR